MGKAFHELEWMSGFASLGSSFVSTLAPTPLPDIQQAVFSTVLAEELGIDLASLKDLSSVETLAGNRTPKSSTPYASVYSGHQFGVWAGQLGDGRAIHLGEIDTQNGPQEMQLKGAGKTPYSRMGDGRAVLRSSIREFLCSEAMHALGVPTTRALSLISSSLPVRRETIESAAVVCRVSPSFIRFGHFQHFASQGLHQELKTLTDFVMHRYYPDSLQQPEPIYDFLQQVISRSAKLVAKWQALGFCHGVLNTDNMSILGLTIDYGPFGMMDQFDYHHVCNHSDQQGRYSYANQPQVFHWNLIRLAESLIPLLEIQQSSQPATKIIEKLEALLQEFPKLYQDHYHELMKSKLGLGEHSGNQEKLIQQLIQLLHDNQIDYTRFFRQLVQHLVTPQTSLLRDQFRDLPTFDAWLKDYQTALQVNQIRNAVEIQQQMNAVNPKYILRQHLAHQAIQLAEKDDFSEVEKLYRILLNPFDEQPEYEEYASHPPTWATQLELSCSS